MEPFLDPSLLDSIESNEPQEIKKSVTMILQNASDNDLLE